MPFDPITYAIFWIPIISLVLFYRQIYNFIIFVFWHKDFVVVHIRKTATRKMQVWHTIPNVKNNFATKVILFKRNRYDLNPLRANFKVKGRNHYIFNEEDFMPLKTKKVWHGLRKITVPDRENYKPTEFDTKELTEREVLFVFNNRLYFKSDDNAVPLKIDPRIDDDYLIGSDEVGGTLEAEQMRIFSKKINPLLMIGLVGLVIICVIVIIYNISKFNEISPLVQTIYERTVVQNGSVTISGR